jgi:alpha-1,6-mannosyltransferase
MLNYCLFYLFDFIYFFFIFSHLIGSPFTKVEESFYLQSVHDLIYKSNISEFDHVDYPGVVPRSAFPSLILSSIAFYFNFFLSKFNTLILIRSLVGICIAHQLGNIQRKIMNLFGKETSLLFLFITISQPHFLFYSSRTLPNILVMPLVLKTLCYYPLGDEISSFIQLSSFCILIFRSELALLFGSYLFYGLYNGQVSFSKLIVNGVIGSVVSLVCTIPFDSFFWDYLIWPEGAVFKFNAIEGRSAEWGVMPFFWYFESALPRACLATLVFVPFGLLSNKVRPDLIKIFLPSVLFIFLYSFNGHKELRFIFYIIPIFNITAACGMNYVYDYYKNKNIRMAVLVGLVGVLCLNFGATIIFSTVSSLNYPGGAAMAALHQHIKCDKFDVTLHITNLATQTGVSQFGQECSNWNYDKTENLTISDLANLDFTHLIVENNEETVFGLNHKYRLVKTIDQYHKIKVTPFPPAILTKESLVILERKDLLELLAPKSQTYENNWIHDDL